MDNSSYVPSARELGEGVGFDRIRRITGYLVGTLDRFNGGKKAEEHDRVKHSTSNLAYNLSNISLEEEEKAM